MGIRQRYLAQIWCGLALAGLFSPAGSASLRAQENEAHLSAIAAFAYIDALPKPPLLAGVGRSHLPITTNSAEAQTYFNQGLNLLHCFWDFEALRAFRQVVRLDPDAAMGYWGLYRALEFSQSGSKEDLAALAETAAGLSSRASEHEQFYIRALSLQQKGDFKGYRSELEALASRYPGDVDAQLFLAVNLWSGYSPEGRPAEGQNYALTILRYLLKARPDHHGVHHYWIHLTEMSPEPGQALPSAQEICGLAPASGHIAHMAGHVHFRTGDYEKARQAFLEAMETDRSYLDQNGLRPIDNWNYFHNLDFLVSNCAEDGRYADGERWANVLQEFELPPEPTDASTPHFVSTRGRVRLMRGKFALPEFYVRFAHWGKAVAAIEALRDDPALSGAEAQLYLRQLGRFSGAMQALEEKRIDAAEDLADALDAEMWRRKDVRPTTEPLAEMSILESLSMELRGRLESARGNHAAAAAILEQASKARSRDGGDPPFYPRPVQESLAGVHLAAGDFAAARAAYLEVLKIRPHSGHALFGIAQCYEKEGDGEASAKAYREFLNAWRHADATLEQVQHARAWLNRGSP